MPYKIFVMVNSRSVHWVYILTKLKPGFLRIHGVSVKKAVTFSIPKKE